MSEIKNLNRCLAAWAPGILGRGRWLQWLRAVNPDRGVLNNVRSRGWARLIRRFVLVSIVIAAMGSFASSALAANAISGVVTDATTHVAVAGASVIASDVSSPNLYTATTAADGSYTMTGVPAGSYTVEFVGASPYAPQWYSNKPSAATADPVAVNASTTTTGINAALAIGGSISGTVKSSSGAAVSGVDVQVFDAQDDFVNSATTGSTGTYIVDSLPAGSYTVEFIGTGSFAVQYYNNQPTLAKANFVAVSLGATTSGINATFGIGAMISGTVTSATTHAGIPAVEVDVYDSTGSLYVTDSTAPNGTYTMTQLPAGTYRVGFTPAAGYAPLFYNGASSLAGATSISLAAGATKTGVNGALTATSATLTVALAGNGSGLVTGSGISCPLACSSTYPFGTHVTLTAAPGAGSVFAGWSGAGFGGNRTCVVSLATSQNVTAIFGPLGAGPPGGAVQPPGAAHLGPDNGGSEPPHDPWNLEGDRTASLSLPVAALRPSVRQHRRGHRPDIPPRPSGYRCAPVRPCRRLQQDRQGVRRLAAGRSRHADDGRDQIAPTQSAQTTRRGGPDRRDPQSPRLHAHLRRAGLRKADGQLVRRTRRRAPHQGQAAGPDPARARAGDRDQGGYAQAEADAVGGWAARAGARESAQTDGEGKLRSGEQARRHHAGAVPPAPLRQPTRLRPRRPSQPTRLRRRRTRPPGGRARSPAVAVEPLARDPVEVAARVQLGDHGERQHLHPAPEDVVGRRGLVAQLAEVLRARVAHVDQHLRRVLGRQLDLAVAACTTRSPRGSGRARGPG